MIVDSSNYNGSFNWTAFTRFKSTYIDEKSSSHAELKSVTNIYHYARSDEYRIRVVLNYSELVIAVHYITLIHYRILFSLSEFIKCQNTSRKKLSYRLVEERCKTLICYRSQQQAQSQVLYIGIKIYISKFNNITKYIYLFYVCWFNYYKQNITS